MRDVTDILEKSNLATEEFLGQLSFWRYRSCSRESSRGSANKAPGAGQLLWVGGHCGRIFSASLFLSELIKHNFVATLFHLYAVGALPAMDSAEFIPFQDKLKSSLVQVTRTVGQLSSEDLNFHRTSSAEVTESLDEQSLRILTLTSAVLKAATTGTDIKAPTLYNEDSIDDNWRGVVDVIDSLLEKADACLDEFTGVIKKLSPSQEEAAPVIKKAPKFPTVYDYGPSKIPKPQLQFEHKPDNSGSSLFRPLLTSKPHATLPLDESLKTREIDGGRSVPSSLRDRDP